MSSLLRPLFFSVLMALGIPNAAAEPDDLEAQAVAGRWALRWDDPRGQIQWLTESEESRSADQALQLKPGDEFQVQVPARADLRLRSPHGQPLRSEELSIWIDNGTGLALELAPTRAGEELHLHSHLDIPALIRMRRTGTAERRNADSGQSGDALALRLYVSREVTPPPAVRYRDRVALPGQSRRVDASRTGSAERFVLLPARSPIAVELEGPLRLMLTSRLDEPTGDAGWDGEFRIQARLDGQPLRTIEHLTRPDYRRPVTVDGVPRVLGRPERGFIEIPDGRHRLTLEGSADLLVQLLAHKDPDFLFPDLNLPRALQAERTPLRPPVCAPPWVADLQRQAPSAVWCRALGLARDNRYRPGGMAATRLLRTQAATRRELPNLNDDARNVRRRYSRFRDLLPTDPTIGIRHAAFPTPQLLAPGAVRRLRLDAPQRRALADRLADGAFVAVEGAPRAYRLPRRDTEGSLRLAVAGAGTGAGELWLQLDGATPKRLQVRPRQPGDRFQLDPAWESQDRAGPGLSAPRTRPAPLVAAATIELPLPPDVEGFRLWSADGTQLWVATAYRTAAPYRVPERGYLDLLARVGAERALTALFDTLDTAKAPVSADPDIAALRNAWLPWIRALNTRTRRFSSDVVADEPVPFATPLDNTGMQRLRRRTTTATRENAVQAWAELAQHSRGTARSKALVRLADAMHTAGEIYLAERLRRSLTLRAVPGAATALAQQYRKDTDAEALETLSAVQFRRHPGPDTLLALVNRLAEQGHSREVLELGLLLAQPDRLSDSLRGDLLNAALEQGWDRTFTRLARDLPEEERKRWEGHQAAARGDWEAALGHYEAAGTPPELATLRQALDLRSRLADPRDEVRESALADWSAQQMAGTGPKRWRPAPWLATAGSGVALVDAEQAHVLSRLLARPDAPVRLRVTGPARLRLETRLLHGSEQGQPQQELEDWLLIRQGDRVRRIPLPISRPVPGLERIGGGARPGTRFEHVLDLPAGEHAIALSTRAAPMAIGVALEQPLVAWLGPRTPAATALVRAGGWDRNPRPDTTGALTPRPLTLLAAAGMRRLPARPLPSPSSDWTELAAPSGQPLPPEPDSPTTRMGALLWKREQTGALSPELVVAASRLLTEHPSDSPLAQLGQRLLRGARWKRLEQLEQGAGLRLRELPSWQPDNPALRGRLAMLAPPLPGESFLIGDAKLGLDVSNPAASTLALELNLDRPRFLTLEDTTVEVRVDGAPLHRVLLSAQQARRTLDLKLSAGEHHVQVLVADPIAHQVVRVRMLESQGNELAPVVEALQRSYQTATREQPLVAHIEGPAWLRLDEWRDGESQSSFRAVNSGWQELVLLPEDGRDLRLLRLFVLSPPAAGDESERAQLRPLPAAGPRLAAPKLEPGAGAAPYSPNAGPDIAELPLGGHEDGTLSLRLGLVQTAGIDGDEEQGIPDEYAEIGATYREYLPRWRAWWRGEMLNRWRDNGRPTLGLRARFYRQPERLPFDYDLRGAWYGQWLPDGLAWSANASLSLSRRMDLGSKAYHRARLTLFGRDLNSDEPPAGIDVDQNVYSDYKSDHRYGLRYAHSLHSRPWRDAEWRLGTRLASNERLYSLDHAALRAGWRQRLGSFGLDGELRWTRYFADDDRSSTLDRRRLTLGIAWEGWRHNGHRLEVDLQWLKDFDIGDHGLRLVLNWNASRGRGFRDFTPGEIQFPDLRTWGLWELDDAQ